MAQLNLWIAGLMLAPAAATAPPPAATPEKPTTVEGVVITAPSASPPLKLKLEPHSDFAPRDYQPYLRQRPVNGCKPMAGGATSAAGKQGVAGGVFCSRSF